MDKRLTMLMLLYLFLLLSGLKGFVEHSHWSPVKLRKFYVYMLINIVSPGIVFMLNSRFVALRHEYLAGILIHPDKIIPASAGLFGLAGIYLTAVVSLLLSQRVWPFDKKQLTAFKTFIFVLLAALCVEVFAGIQVPESTNFFLACLLHF